MLLFSLDNFQQHCIPLHRQFQPHSYHRRSLSRPQTLLRPRRRIIWSRPWLFLVRCRHHPLPLFHCRIARHPPICSARHCRRRRRTLRFLNRRPALRVLHPRKSSNGSVRLRSSNENSFLRHSPWWRHQWHPHRWKSRHYSHRQNQPVRRRQEAMHTIHQCLPLHRCFNINCRIRRRAWNRSWNNVPYRIRRPPHRTTSANRRRTKENPRPITFRR